MTKDAFISKCGKYRYSLTRTWDASRPAVMFIGLNPSTADGFEDDPTVKKCMKFAQTWGYGGLHIGNLFAFRATEPAQMLAAPFPIGCENDTRLRRLASQSARVIAAWGDEGCHLQRSLWVRRMIPDLYFLKLNGSKEPSHPLYLPPDASPSPMQPTPSAALDGSLLSGYCDVFFGFGNWAARIWFIGIEEAGGWEFRQVERRLSAWNSRGRLPLEDAPAFYPFCGNECWHGPDATVQSTWRQLIRMFLLLEGQPDTESDILNYQRTHWGSANGDVCLAELFPLPSPSTADWPYAEWSDLPWLQNRASYISRVRAARENELRRRIQQHQPEVVIFYGLELPGGVSLLPSWSSIAGGQFEQAFRNERSLLTRQKENTTFYVTRHPVAESDEYFTEIGEFLHQRHGKQK